MHPVWFKIGNLPIHWYGVMMALGFLAGYANWFFLTRDQPRNMNMYADLLFWIIISGVGGARIAYVLGDLKHFIAHPSQIIRVDQGGLTYYGGVIGAAVAILLFARRQKQSVLALLDLVVTSVPLAHAFGRIGCFLNGCCYGKVHQGLCSVHFPQHSLAWYDHYNAGEITATASRSLPVLPTQLFEAGWNLVVYLLLLWAFRRKPYCGFTTGFYLVTYPVGRFLIEFMRGDDRLQWHGLSAAQILSIGFILFGAGILIVKGHEARKRLTAAAKHG